MASESPQETPAQQNDGTPPPPSFSRHLKLNDFMYKGGSTTTTAAGGPLRRSPRLGSTPSGSDTAPTPPPTRPTPPAARPSPTKRKTPTNDPPDSQTITTTTTSKRPRQKPSSSYAPPSHYAHLPPLQDVLSPNLLVLFIGLNPGIQTARTGHAYAHPTNLFWRLLHTSGITPDRQLAPTEDRTLPSLYSLGNTNIVARPSRNGAELSRGEMDAGVDILEAKARRWRPEAVCVVGKSIWESLWRVRHGRSIRAHEFRYGWQDESENIGVGDQQTEDEVEEGVEYRSDWKGARVFVATSTSGLAATLSPQEKQRIWRELGEWVEKRREERAAAKTES
ncbi:hydrolase-like protein [Echria macrotheca]|uniref:Hydrolase-like protein n=1 Tax=Echria macrotheca TaxID=438768 RepID=A0AAJ0BC24_9PEZI|nr:hydrolase-like protein [Echria macrotheca]